MVLSNAAGVWRGSRRAENRHGQTRPGREYHICLGSGLVVVQLGAVTPQNLGLSRRLGALGIPPDRCSDHHIPHHHRAHCSPSFPASPPLPSLPYLRSSRFAPLHRHLPKPCLLYPTSFGEQRTEFVTFAFFYTSIGFSLSFRDQV